MNKKQRVNALRRGNPQGWSCRLISITLTCYTARDQASIFYQKALGLWWYCQIPTDSTADYYPTRPSTGEIVQISSIYSNKENDRLTWLSQQFVVIIWFFSSCKKSLPINCIWFLWLKFRFGSSVFTKFLRVLTCDHPRNIVKQNILLKLRWEIRNRKQTWKLLRLICFW